MSLLWIVTVASLFVALVAIGQVRRMTKRLTQLSQRYWELKYQCGELRLQVQRLAGDAPPAPAPPPAELSRVPDGFIPITSLKR